MTTTLLIQHEVADFTAWKSVFDQDQDNRRNHGAISHRVVRDGNLVTALVDFPDTKTAESFVEDPRLRDAMAHAGVAGAPSIKYTEEIESVSY